MNRDQQGKTPASIRIKKLLTEFLLIPAFVAQLAVGCASNSEPSSPTSPTYLTREIGPLKSLRNPDIKFTIAPLTGKSAKLKTEVARTPAGSVRVWFDVDEKGKASVIVTEIVGDTVDPSEVGPLRNAAYYLLRDNLKINATLDGRSVAATAVETVIHFDRVWLSQALDPAATSDEYEGAKTVGLVALAVVGIIVLIPLVVLTGGGSVSFGN
jgi:hypothetical protein